MKALFGFAAIICLQQARAVDEPYMNELKGNRVKADSTFTVADEKFIDPSAWSLIQHNISVNNIISFEINFDTSIYFYNQPFACTVNFKIYIYGNQSDTSEITDSVTHSNISLTVRYDTVTGKPYKGVALYKFLGAHKYKVKILSITSPQLSPIPAIFRLKGQIIIDRKYTFNDNSTDVTRFSVINTNQLRLDWTPSNYPGAEQFDLEYTHIDGASQVAASIRSYESGGNYFVPADSLAKWFRNNNSRITTPASSYLLNIPYDSGFVLFRIRGVQNHYPDGVRYEGNWNYSARPIALSCSTCPAGAIFFDSHEENLNWQYIVAFGEEGKRKEQTIYFDGTLRKRQSVSINNSDNKNIVEETIYDAMGRRALNILPAPTDDSTIHYFRGFNRNSNGDPYSFADLLYGGNCSTTADSLSYTSGAGRYYSSNNQFLNSYYHAKYIPDGGGYPFSVTEYMADNTNRVKAQGGVGPFLQLGSEHTLRHFYGKPTQTELDRLFGSEAGLYNHYLKNLIVDPNGNISVSYVNASGKTVATALAGAAPPNLHALPSGAGASVQVTDDLMQPGDFTKSAGDYSIEANSTFLAPVTGTYVLDYRVDPLRMEKLFGPDKDSVICNNCYYDLIITVKDDCNNTIAQETRAAGTVFDTACANPTGPITDTIGVEIEKVGEYYVSYRLVISRDALNFYDSVHLEKNSDIRELNYFLLEELKQTDFYGCYSRCETCLDALGTKEEFKDRFKVFYTADSLAFTPDDSLFVLSLYDSLYSHCLSIQGECALSVCDEKLEMLKMDVMPGGQYALYDTATYDLLEPSINVLAMRDQIVFFTNTEGTRDSVMLQDINGEDSVKLDVKELNDEQFILYWKDEWADSLVRLHPEYCYYLWCLANSESFQFDSEIETWLSADTAITRGWFNPNVYDTILAHDPFFLPGGNGFDLRDAMSDSLRLFSRTYARTALPDRNILQFIDVVLYCSQQANGWESCNPDSACRSHNREWFLYRQLYLNLKQYFYEVARRTSSNPVFANCVNCYIGKDELGSGIPPCTPPLPEEFIVEILLTPESPEPIPSPGGPAIESSLEGPIVFIKHPAGPPGKNLIVTATFYLGGVPTPYNFRFPGNVTEIQITQFIDSADISYDSIKVTAVLCDTTFIPFAEPTTCNYNCAAGVYNPYDKDSISVYIEYGNPNISPTGTPSGYGNCAFYSAYLLQTGPNTTCKFFNVWVCTYDSTCGGICSVTEYPSSCPENPNAALYENKVRRYPEYVNAHDFLNTTQGGNAQVNSEVYEQLAINECRSNCEAQADIWINQLQRCTTDTSLLSQLKQALIEVCQAGCSIERPFGASTAPPESNAPYASFEEAIEVILGPGSINDSCTAELLANPYPYDKQPSYVERIISETNYEICLKIGQYKTAWQNSGFTGSFHSYLLQTSGGRYDLDSLELDDLLNSCTNCNGILKDDIVLPIIFEPNAPPCLLCDSVQAAMTAFNDKFPSITEADDDYETLVENFFNHRFGYSLGYSEYKTYIDSCTVNVLFTGRLCNAPATRETTVDYNGDDCMADLFNTALTNATNTYIAYIDSVRRDFREAYMTRCMNVQPALTMSAELYEYHYTLNYYDQSGNLVKTIPPEGVALLNEDSLELVKLHRLLQNEGCYQYSDSILFNNNGHINWNYVDSFEARPFTVEMMANLTSYSDQVLVSKLTELEYDTSGPGPFYRYAGFILKFENDKLAVDVYGVGADTTQRSALAVSVLDASAVLPLNLWRHVVVERTNERLNPVRLWVNGNPVTLQYTANDLDSAVMLGGDSSLIVGSYVAPNFTAPDRLRGTLKNLRVYNRLLLPSEIRQITYNNCQVPANKTGLLFWSAMNNATNNLVKDMVSQGNGVLTGFEWEPFAGIFPVHRMPTTYQHNSYNEVVMQYSPDTDTARLYYDRVGRFIASQNKEQELNASYSGPANRFSYTKHDKLNRIIETGEKSGPSSNISEINLLDSIAVNAWLSSGTDRQVTKTLHDDPVNTSIQSAATSRKRAVASVYLENADDAEGDSILYSYDILGNIQTVVQHIKALVAVDPGNGKKRIDYQYDIITNRLSMLSYQQGKGDQFFYKFRHDADSRMIAAYSSRDKLIWTEDASYTYYLHGALARTELGQLKVQGIDRAHTIHGWVKGVNSDSLNPKNDMGGDGWSGSLFGRVSRDVFAMEYNRHANDYTPVGGSVAGAFNHHSYTAPVSLDMSGNEMFTGQVSNSTLALSKIANGSTVGYTYGYDQIYRVVNASQHALAGAWSNSNMINAYRQSVAYDANGNITKLLRRGADAPGMPLQMDSLSYKYNLDAGGHLINNWLNHVRDSVGAANYDIDIDDQSPGNYAYDKNGNLTRDEAEGLDSIHWTTYNLIYRIKKTSGDVLNFGYNGRGQRILKQHIRNDTTVNTYYVHDVKGNLIAVYTYSTANAQLKWSEQHLYGDGRLGTWQWDTVVPALPPVPSVGTPIHDSLLYGSRTYELTNHLNSVMATISDKKIGNDSSGVVNYFYAEVLSQQDYYSFGMIMAGRSIRIPNKDGYRHGYNGRENDDEVKGMGNQLDFGRRIYDPRLGRFLSTDPVRLGFPGFSPYLFGSNDPVNAIDLEGLLTIYITDIKYNSDGTIFKIVEHWVTVVTFEEALTGLVRTPIYVTVHSPFKLDDDRGQIPRTGDWYGTFVSEYDGGLDEFEAMLENQPKWLQFLARAVNFGADKIGVNKIAAASRGKDVRGNKVEGVFSRLVMALDGATDFVGVVTGGKKTNLGNLVTDLGTDVSSEKIVDAIAAYLKTYAKEEIQKTTIDIVAANIKILIELQAKDEPSAKTMLTFFNVFFQNFEFIIQLQDYINANGGSLPLGPEEAVNQAVMRKVPARMLPEVIVTEKKKSKSNQND